MAPSYLTRRYLKLLSAARETGQDQRYDLERGARITVRARGGIITVTFSRLTQPLGDTELKTFHTHCEIPAGAERIPAEGQKPVDDAEYARTRHLVAYRWPDTADMFASGEPL